MTRESLARRFRPAGFEQPEGSRRNYVKPRAELQEAFDLWVDGLPTHLEFYDERVREQYERAKKMIRRFGEIKYKEANSLLVGFKPKTDGQKDAGLFVSSCYTHSPEKIIVFDLDASEIDHIGYRTNKNIFNNGKVRNWFALNSSGLAVNNGECGDGFAREYSGTAVNNGECAAWFALNSSGLAVNNGECGDGFAWEYSGLAVAVKEPEGYGHRVKGRTIQPAGCNSIPELKKYMEELSEISRNIKDEESAKMFLERYCVGGYKIKQEGEDILERGDLE